MMSIMNTGISVVIPTYNREQFIIEAVQSVLHQDYTGTVEIIISDDGSTDQTLEKINSLNHGNKKIVILNKPLDCNTQGASGARNRGIKASTQPLVCFLDSDDFYLPDHLKSMAEALLSDTNLGFVFCRTLEVKVEDGKKIFKPWTRQRVFENDISNPIVSRDLILNTNSIMVKREVFNDVGYFNEIYSNGEDIDLWMRISEKYKGKFVDHYGAVYRIQHGAGQLTASTTAVINNNVSEVLGNAISRYYKLNLKDSNRIFELKHMLLHRKFSGSKFTYLLKYFSLISKYPICFLRRVPIQYYQFLEKEKMNKWADIDYFI
jgi:glycosyltransferase involved in cell wall biosynthesis